MNQGLVQISHVKNDESIPTPEPLEIPYTLKEAQVSPLVICVPTPFPFESTKVVPWNYNTTTYVGNKPMVLESDVTSIAGVRGMTRSGRVFAPEQPQEKSVVEPSKGKGVLDSDTNTRPSPKAISQEEVDEFLWIIKRSDYEVVDHLNQTPSKISMISVLFSL